MSLRPATVFLFILCQLGFSLSENCPPSFFKTRDGRCQLESPYLRLSPGVITPLSLDPKRVHLGKKLFFDRNLSKDRSVSCASCHPVSHSFSDPAPRSVGASGVLTRRQAPSLWNVAFKKTFFWDARASSLEEQARGPLFNDEMGMTPQELNRRLAKPEYLADFESAFHSTPNTENAILAIAEYERSLVSLNSAFDQHVFGWNPLGEKERSGLHLFQSFVTRCWECHTPPLFTTQQTARIGVPSAFADNGAGEQRFLIPSLRNVSRTAPYMHQGQFLTLLDVVRFYNDGGERAFFDSPKTHWHIRKMDLSNREMDELVTFLNTLNDESALTYRPEDGE